MGSRLLAAVFALCLAASAQTMSVEKLRQFLASNIEMIKQGKSSDRELAGFLDKAKLTEKLEERQIKGEVVLLVTPAPAPCEPAGFPVADLLRNYTESGKISLKDAVKRVVQETGRARSEVYAEALRLKKES